MNPRLSTTHKPYFQNNAYSDYTLSFDPISNWSRSVHFIDHSKGEERTIGVTINDEAFKYRVQEVFPPIIADLIDLAVAIHASDRLAHHDLEKKQRRLHIALPVRHPELLNAESFRSKLDELLEWATDSQWIFDFKRRKEPGRSVEQQLILPMATQGCEVALWSGGLDALAGLYTRLKTAPEKSFVLFGTGSNEATYARQKSVAERVQTIFPNRCHLIRVPVRFHDSGPQKKNVLSRARGVVFTLLGAACAYLMGQRVLCVYENGIGAINLAYRASAVGLAHSRSVHPLTLLLVSSVISELLGQEFRVQNPFLFWTKAQMCKGLAEDGRKNLSALTVSCDSPHRQQPTQCGYCSSCLLRRQALAAASIEDQTRYVVLHGKRPVGNPSLPLCHMLTQVDTLRHLFSNLDKSEWQWEALTREFPILDDIVDQCAVGEHSLPAEMQGRLIQLYQRYVFEWDEVKLQIAANILNKCTDQHIFGSGMVAAQPG